MKDGSDAVADWPILNALLNTASGASWVSFHHGGGVGIGYSLHAGQVSVADGTDEAAKRLNRVLTNDPGLGVARHVDAGYEEAAATATSNASPPTLSSRPMPWMKLDANSSRRLYWGSGRPGVLMQGSGRR